MPISKHLLLSILMCLSLQAPAQRNTTFPIHFNTLTTADGLSYNQIRTLYQDSYGFIWIGTSYGLNRYDGYTFKHFFYDANDPAGINSNQIRWIWEDQSRNIWVATSSKTLNRYNRATESFEQVVIPGIETFIFSAYQTPGSNTIYMCLQDDSRLQAIDLTKIDMAVIVSREKACKSAYPIENMLQDSRGHFWFSDWQALYLYDPTDESIQCFRHEVLDEHSLNDSYVSAIYEDKQGRIWVGTPKGLNCWDPEAQHFQRISPADYLPDLDNPLLSYITSIEEDAKGNLWLGTGDGLLYYDLAHDRFAAYPSHVNDLPGGGIYDLMMDKSGVLWIGAGEGLCRLYPNPYQFDRGVHDILLTSVKEAGTVRHIVKTGPGTYWLSTNYALFQAWNLNGNITRQQMQYGAFHGLYHSESGRIFAGALNDGVFQYEQDQLTKHLPKANGHLQGSYIWAITEDVAGTLWVAAVGDLNRYDPKLDQFEQYDNQEHQLNDAVDLSDIYNFCSDHRGNLWIGTPYGLLVLSREELQKPIGTPLDFKAYYHDSQYANSLSSSYINCIYEAADGSMWIGTDNGLNQWANGQFIRYQEGLPGKKIMAILDDDSGHLWLGTTDGLAHFDRVGKTFTNYFTADGLPSNSFQLDNCLKEDDGTLVFGTEKGFISFQPDSLTRNTHPPKVYITDFKLFNQPVKIGAYDSLLTKAIQYSEALELRHDQNVLTFEFAALNYFDPERNTYAYQMIGFDDTLQYIGHRREATFTNLNAGDYTFWVTAANNHGIWNTEGIRLHLRILPPWYRTWWAYLLWIGLFLVGIYQLYRFQLSRQLSKAEAERLRELDVVKTNLYTNITHEFRTPLTVILGMAKNIQDAPEEWSAKGATMIERNGQSLLDLVNQMLDLSKLEAGKLSVNPIQADLIAYLQQLIEPFQVWAGDRKLQLHFLPESTSILMDFDPEKIRAIVSNLLSNAIKFTPPAGDIYFRIQVSAERSVQLTVADTGKGIASSELSHIFDRFYQAESASTIEGGGTGIGLALTKALVELLEGRIEVRSTIGKGTTFVIILPIKRQATFVSNLSANLGKTQAAAAPAADPNHNNGNFPLLLIVEDNEDVVHYLKSCLSTNYRLSVAKNGQEGLEKALALQPDMVISDVMMPVKNGFELCTTLKQHPQGSHIPIILLTAKADMDSKLEGLDTGADAYLAKPFQKEELLIRVRKLIELRRQLRQYYTSVEFFNLSVPPGENQDELFLYQFKTFIEEQLDSPDLDVEVLCKKMGLSRTAFYHKVNALVGMPPATYIRLVRLNYAKKLLAQSDLTITQIAYQCGFSSQSLFTRSFTSHEGMSPSEFRTYHL
ncbi:MAG: two-component regulator propeller domain-containing protein [Saprospiraceae bacterium]|nr:response regulator [Lewinella sp.]